MTPEQSSRIEKIFIKSRVLITGGLGFIGSNLARRLLDLGANLTLVDSLKPDYGGNLFNIAGVEHRLHANISDVRDEHSLQYLVRDKDFLFNLAGQTSHLDSMNDPYSDLEINSRAQLYILEACRAHNPSIKIVFASTRQIYGKPDYLPVDEKHRINPVDVNGINKAAGEWYHLLYNQVYGIRTTVLRLTNTYGPRMRIKDARQTFLGLWIKLLLENKPIEVWGGEQLRDMSYVEDCINAMLLAAAAGRANNEVFNLGDKQVISLKQLAELLIEVNGGGRLEIREFPGDRKKIDIGDYYADYSKIRDTLGWEPATSLREGLALTIDYYRHNLARYL